MGKSFGFEWMVGVYNPSCPHRHVRSDIQDQHTYPGDNYSKLRSSETLVEVVVHTPNERRNSFFREYNFANAGTSSF